MFTYVPWQRIGISVNLNEAMCHASHGTNIYCIKRVARKLDDPVRSYIRQKYSYSNFFGLSNLVSTHTPLYLYIMDLCRRI